MLIPTNNMKFILKILGRNPDLPNAADVENPKHGQKANNSRGQKVIYDETQRNNKTGEMGKWVMPQNFSGKPPVTITGNGYVYTEFGIFAEDDTDFSHPLTLDDVAEIRAAQQDQYWRDKLEAEGITSETDVFVVNGVKVKGAQWAWKELHGQLD